MKKMKKMKKMKMMKEMNKVMMNVVVLRWIKWWWILSSWNEMRDLRSKYHFVLNIST
jgi:type III secretory pathway component EscU